jgi:sugar lactone lactonase YvrE
VQETRIYDTAQRMSSILTCVRDGIVTIQLMSVRDYTVPVARTDGVAIVSIYHAEAGLSAPVVDGLCTQNGLAWSPDGRTKYLSDSWSTERLV